MRFCLKKVKVKVEAVHPVLVAIGLVGGAGEEPVVLVCPPSTDVPSQLFFLDYGKVPALIVHT
jgi:hypothetical protein